MDGLANPAALATGTAESLGKGTCISGTFLAAQYASAMGSIMGTNTTAAGLALAAANNANLAGCSVAAASGAPLVSAGCSLAALQTLASMHWLFLMLQAMQAVQSKEADDPCMSYAMSLYIMHFDLCINVTGRFASATGSLPLHVCRQLMVMQLHASFHLVTAASKRHSC